MTIFDNRLIISAMSIKLKNGHPAKSFNVMEAARLIGVHERTVRYWLRKNWIKARRDYRNFPVFTPQDILKIKKWRVKLIKE